MRYQLRHNPMGIPAGHDPASPNNLGRPRRDLGLGIHQALLPLAPGPGPSNPSWGRRVVSNEERGDGETRTPDTRVANAVLYQLSYDPVRRTPDP